MQVTRHGTCPEDDVTMESCNSQAKITARLKASYSPAATRSAMLRIDVDSADRENEERADDPGDRTKARVLSRIEKITAAWCCLFDWGRSYRRKIHPSKRGTAAPAGEHAAQHRDEERVARNILALRVIATRFPGLVYPTRSLESPSNITRTCAQRRVERWPASQRKRQGELRNTMSFADQFMVWSRRGDGEGIQLRYVYNSYNYGFEVMRWHILASYSRSAPSSSPLAKKVPEVRGWTRSNWERQSFCHTQKLR